MKTIVSTITAAAILYGGSFIVVRAEGQSHVIQTPQEAQWGPAPPMLPAGAQIAVVAGDPTKPVPYTIRLKFPANYAIPAHSHPTDEHVLVVSGSLTFGMGETLAQIPALRKPEITGVLLLVDQFEELFRFANLRSESSLDAATAAERRDEARHSFVCF